MKKDIPKFSFERKDTRVVMRTIALLLVSFSVLTVQVYGAGAEIAFGKDFPGKRAENSPANEFAFTVSGKVTDETGEPLPGVNVLEKGTNNGTVTDAKGKYALNVADGNATLVFSFIGYAGQEVAIGDRGVIDIGLAEDTKTLSEVVVVGYGVQKKTDLTGAISSIPVADIAQFPTARADQALQGRASGVYVLNTDGSPGGNAMIRIRGLNSINGGNEPLIVIDGLQGGSINSLNPNDIASMEILKDASATAIYGSRGANGVILITTKLGRKGKPVIDAGYNLGIQTLSHKLPVMDAATYAKTFNAYRMTDTGNGNIPTPQFTDAQIANWEKNGGTDWQDEVYKTGVLQNFQLGVSGATDKLKYLVSGNYLDHNGILVKSKYERASIRANIAADIASWVDFGLNYAFTRESLKSPSFSTNGDGADWIAQTANNAPRWAPTEPVYDAQGNYWVHTPGYGASDTWNPMASAKEPIIDNPTYRNNANLFLNFKIIKGLSFKVTGGALLSNTYKRDYYNSKTLAGLQNNGFGNINESKSERYQNSNILTYDNTFNKHHITFTGVLEQITDEYMGSNMQGRGFLVDQLGFDNFAGAKSVKVSSFHGKRALLSYMGRLNYVYSEKYMATLTYRADGSSVFGAGNKWGYFPSGSVAWRISEEPFMKDLGFFNELKLRASYGQTGNQGINPYESLARLGSGINFNYPYNGQGAATDIGFGLSAIANPKLKWETTKQTDIGMDFSLFNGRLTGTIDWYKKVTKDLLMPRQLPGYVGVSTVLDNVGSVQNQGLEILIGGDPVVLDNFRWNTSVNFTRNRNKVLDIGPNDKITYGASNGGYSLNNFMFLQVGEPFGLMNGWKFLGIWRTDQDAEARSYGQLPGDPHYLDVNKDGVINSDDRTTIGHGYPKFTWGWTNQLSYKRFSLSFLVIGYQGVDLFNTLRIRRDSPWEGNSPVLLDRWTPDHQNTNVPGYIDGKYRQDQGLTNKVSFPGNASGVTSRWVEDASFIRLKTATVAYSFGPPSLKVIGFQKIRVFMSGTNLLTKTKYTGYDPEVAAFPSRDATIGVDFSSYPTSKTYTFGFELTF